MKLLQTSLFKALSIGTLLILLSSCGSYTIADLQSRISTAPTYNFNVGIPYYNQYYGFYNPMRRDYWDQWNYRNDPWMGRNSYWYPRLLSYNNYNPYPIRKRITPLTQPQLPKRPRTDLSRTRMNGNRGANNNNNNTPSRSYQSNNNNNSIRNTSNQNRSSSTPNVQNRTNTGRGNTGGRKNNQ